MTTDAKIHDIAVAYILKNMGRFEWPFRVTPFTVIGVLHPSFAQQLSLAEGELVVVSAFFSTASWYAFTTRRIVSQFQGITQSLVPSHGIESDFPNFKGHDPGDDSDLRRPGVVPRDIATISDADSQAVVRFEYETGAAGAFMAPMWAVFYWQRKHSYLNILITTAKRELYKARNG